MNRKLFALIFAGLCAFPALLTGGDAPERTITVLWKNAPAEVSLQAENGRIGSVRAVRGQATRRKDALRFAPGAEAAVACRIDSAQTQAGPESTLIHVRAGSGSFSFFLRDVGSENPIYIPAYGTIVLPGGDDRSYDEAENDILSRKNLTKIQRIEREPETSFASASARTRRSNVPIWLGLSRDMRMFEIAEELEDTYLDEKVIKPMNSSSAVVLPETSPTHIEYRYALGRGVGVMDNIRRRLEDGVLPIYHSEMTDDDIVYRSTSFVSLAGTPLNERTVRGTHYLISDRHSAGRVFTDEQSKQLEQVQRQDTAAKPLVALYIRTIAENTGSVPRYAWFKAPRPSAAYRFDGGRGYTGFSENRISCISKVDGKALHEEETAILLQPGQRIEIDFLIPHEPVSAETADALTRENFSDRQVECKAYWQKKLDRAARIRLPEKRIDEMLRAGLLHLDLITFGTEPDGTLAANVGVYSPIGTESAPIIQFYASMGLEQQAKRALNYFLDTQQPDGNIENYNGYTVETGAALWSVGEYFRYTRDRAWIEQIRPKLLKACDYLMRWRAKSFDEKLRGKGYGMIDGKVADPEDPFHQFMLNGYGYLGLSRMAETLGAIDPACGDSLRREAEAWRQDVRESFFQSLARSPVVPLGDGTWCPTAAPWAEAPGPRLLFLKNEKFRSHGTFTVPDGLLGPMYLVFCEVIEPDEPAARMLLDYHSELMFQENSAFSQPYYSRHNWYQAKTDMVKPFLSTYYHTVAPHADRQTYTFWEHMYKLSAHKTHEEANFLMETRWMLYMEDADTLHLFRVAPRAWFADGERIDLEGVRSYFGRIDARVRSHVGEGYIEATVTCDPERKPSRLAVRLPHPQGKKPVRVTGGRYDETTESVLIDDFDGEASIRLEY